MNIRIGTTIHGYCHLSAFGIDANDILYIKGKFVKVDDKPHHEKKQFGGSEYVIHDHCQYNVLPYEPHVAHGKCDRGLFVYEDHEQFPQVDDEGYLVVNFPGTQQTELGEYKAIITVASKTKQYIVTIEVGHAFYLDNETEMDYSEVDILFVGAVTIKEVSVSDNENTNAGTIIINKSHELVINTCSTTTDLVGWQQGDWDTLYDSNNSRKEYAYKGNIEIVYEAPVAGRIVILTDVNNLQFTMNNFEFPFYKITYGNKYIYVSYAEYQARTLTFNVTTSSSASYKGTGSTIEDLNLN